MSNYETLSILISVLAVSVSFIALYRSRKTHSEFLELEKIHAELSRKQLEEFDEKEALKVKTQLSVQLIFDGENYRFYISNQGNSSATDIWFRMEQGGEYNPLLQNEYKEKIPFPCLNSGEEFTLLASIPINVSQQVYPVAMRWKNEDGTQGDVVCSVSK